MDGSVRGMSTTNSVRWAGKTWTENSTGAPLAVRVTRSHRRTGDAGGTPSRSASSGVAASAAIVWLAPPSGVGRSS